MSGIGAVAYSTDGSTYTDVFATDQGAGIGIDGGASAGFL